jgi:RNA polymerase sigma factor (sigma-70 family)
MVGQSQQEMPTVPIPIVRLSPEQAAIVAANLPLARWFVKRSLARGLPPGIDGDDVFSEVTFAMVRAVPHWLPERGALSTYLTFWMRGALANMLRRHQAENAGRVPAGTGERSLDLNEVADRPDYLDADDLAAVLELAQGLSDRDRLVIEMRLAGATTRGVAEALGVSEKRIHQRSGRAVRRLRGMVG